MEVRLEDGVNGALMDLFDPLHAQVLLSTAEPQSCPRAEVPADVGKFLDAAIEGLRKVARWPCD